MKGEYEEKGRGRDENFGMLLSIARRGLAEDRRGDQLKETESAETKRKVQERGLNEVTLTIVEERGEDAEKIKIVAQHLIHCRNAR